jgi:hypothetical protein
MPLRIAAAQSLTRFNEQRVLPLFTKLITAEEDTALRFFGAPGAVYLPTIAATDQSRSIRLCVGKSLFFCLSRLTR